MAGVNKWLVIAACLIIGVVGGIFLHEAIDMFSLFGLGSQRTFLRSERDRIEREHADRDRVREENLAERERGIAEDKKLLERKLEAKQRRLEEYERRDKIIKEREAGNRAATELIGEGLQALERLEGFVGQVE